MGHIDFLTAYQQMTNKGLQDNIYFFHSPANEKHSL